MRRPSVVVILALIAIVSPARGEPELAAPSSEPRPWADGVAADEQTIALGFYEEGNTEFLESRFAQALVRYRQAIAHWDHPAIRFNMAVCLVNLGHLVEARDSLERALAHGAAPLGEDVHVQGLTYRKLLDGQLARLTIRCSEPDAAVTLDGKPMLTCPGAASAYLLPGDHQVVATKPGFHAASTALELGAGTTDVVDVQLLRIEPAATMDRRAPSWQPWAIVAGGVVAAGLGGLALASAADDFRAFDDGVRRACPRGCSAAQVAALPDLRALEDGAQNKQTIATTLIVFGGMTLASGAVVVYLNQPRVRFRPRPAVTPTAGGAAMSLGWAF